MLHGNFCLHLWILVHWQKELLVFANKILFAIEAGYAVYIRFYVCVYLEGESTLNLYGSQCPEILGGCCCCYIFHIYTFQQLFMEHFQISSDVNFALLNLS